MLECVASSYHLIFLHKIQMGEKEKKLNWMAWIYEIIMFLLPFHLKVPLKRAHSTNEGVRYAWMQNGKQQNRKTKGFHIHEKAQNKMSKIG